VHQCIGILLTGGKKTKEATRPESLTKERMRPASCCRAVLSAYSTQAQKTQLGDADQEEATAWAEHGPTSVLERPLARKTTGTWREDELAGEGAEVLATAADVRMRGSLPRREGEQG
jgi:hypothetical protein